MVADRLTGAVPDGAEAGRAKAIAVVLVEDHPGVRAALTALLESAGITVLAAEGTGRRGYLAVKALNPHVAVIDNRLPDGLGTDLCWALRLELPEVATVIYSAELTWEDQERGRLAGAAASVSKTLTGRELIAAITAHAVR